MHFVTKLSGRHRVPDWSWYGAIFERWNCRIFSEAICVAFGSRSPGYDFVARLASPTISSCLTVLTAFAINGDDRPSVAGIVRCMESGEGEPNVPRGMLVSSRAPPEEILALITPPARSEE